MLSDSYGRSVESLRISVTDRCNFRCRYCMPDNGMQWLEQRGLLSFEEIARLVRIVAALGITKLRLTGGEPLMRKELWTLVRLLRGVPDIKEIALTTNGTFLKEQVDRLVEAGLSRINVSLDSLNATAFDAMARRDGFAKTWEGVEAAAASGVGPIKLNVVVLRGVNDGEIERFAEVARTRPFIVRFIEFMPIGKDDEWSIDRVVPSDEVRRRIGALGLLTPIPLNGTKSPAASFRFADGSGEVGFISSVSEPFCDHCNRIRLTSDGKLRTCLFALHETDLRSLLRGGAGDDAIGHAVEDAVRQKERGHLINRPGFVRPARTMNQIGG
jgi:cyclic pyranopterin phosphate synthase